MQRRTHKSFTGKYPLVFRTLALGILLWVCSATAVDVRILIPLYSYPQWYAPAIYSWDDVARAAAEVPVTAVINPANGPGPGFPNSDYTHGSHLMRPVDAPNPETVRPRLVLRPHLLYTDCWLDSSLKEAR
mgnify:CR=1 FL=1